MHKSPQHRSPWISPSSQSTANKRTLASRADVVVVGAGVSGLTTAVLLAQGGRSVVVLDMGNEVASGDTGNSTAHLTSLLDTGYAQLRKDFGDEAARTAWVVHEEAIKHIAEWSQHDPKHCDFQWMPGSMYAETEQKQDNEQIDAESQALTAAGAQVSDRRQPVLPFARGRSLEVPKQGCIDPRAYAQVLAQMLAKARGQLVLNARMTGYEKKQDGIHVHTATGSICAQDVVFATHTPPTLLALQTKMTPMRTYALATEVEDMPSAGLYFDTDEPYHYIRPHLRDGKSLLIVGGHDHRVGAEEDSAHHNDSLEAWVRHRFAVKAITHQWSGQVFEPVDGLPFMGLLPHEEHLYVITGLSGNGITSGSVGAKLVAESILGQPPAWAPIFKPSRIKPVAMANEFMHHQAEVTAHLVGDRVKAWLTNKALKAGEGAVMRDGTHAAAVYNDGSTMHTLSPVCPHAGCYVAWNNSETSWDCPCHGSRFSATGKLLCGPATSDLKAIE